MRTEYPATARRPLSHPNNRIVVPDAPETWPVEEVEYLLWPDSPDHLPERQREEGWAQLIGYQ